MKSIRIIRACGTAATPRPAASPEAFVERIVAFDQAHVPEQLAAAGHIDEQGGPPAP
ncbi:hypothetical protein [Lysobacter sp. TY2-98]|uniref:hypothetical protein n=1 Tax=Lysobacter sp. TY2-98 TaxID=2290922 RepID=UPI0013B3851A|nr:hypothetical protein [Lysobacter sp. TY2-98]